jgi:sugar transferase EpsL
MSEARTRPRCFLALATRIIDVLGAGTALVLLSPVMLVVAIMVRLKLGSPVLFCQDRPCHKGEIKKLYKFRTMTNARGPDGALLPDPERLTPMGLRMRRLSLDELPQLFNVIKGELSLVGPRPLMPQYLSRYTPEQARRHEVKPGITGWAQINGRTAIDWEERFRLDVWYVDHQSVWLNLRILGLTLLKVLKREGTIQPAQPTNSEFMGTTQPRKQPDAETRTK